MFTLQLEYSPRDSRIDPSEFRSSCSTRLKLPDISESLHVYQCVHAANVHVRKSVHY